MYHYLGHGENIDSSDPNKTTQPTPQFQPPVAPHPSGYQQGIGYGAPPPAQHQQQYGNQHTMMDGRPTSSGQGYGALQGQEPLQGQQSPPSQDATLAGQMGGMSLGGGEAPTTKKKKKDRHAFHQMEATGSSQAFNGMPPPGTPASSFLNNESAAQQGSGGHYLHPQNPPQSNQFPAQAGAPVSPVPSSPNPFTSPAGLAPSDAGPSPAFVPTSGQQQLSADDLPSVPVSRDSIQPHYLQNVYPTFERHVPPPATTSFVAFDQGNASPKYARLTMNNVPATAESLASTGLPLGLLLQPLAPLQPGELDIPVLDFGETGPPRCRRCRAYINPFMMFRSGGNKFVCNLCTYPNDTPSEYFAATTPQGVRVDRDQRPELTRGTVEFVVPKEYWTREPVGLRWLFLIDVTQESFNRGFVEAFCEGILSALYGVDDADEPTTDGEPRRSIPVGAKVGFVSYDKDIHFYNVSVSVLDTCPLLTEMANSG